MVYLILGVVIGGFLIGSIPFGFLAGKARGIDIRKHGSGNIGATNVLRTLGKPWGISIFILDALKGVAAVTLGWQAALATTLLPAATCGVLAGVACILGHNFTPWLGFRGGKGIATSAGVLIALMPLVSLVVTIVWFLLFFTTRYVSVASIGAALTLPITVCVFHYVVSPQPAVLIWFSLIAAALAIWRHRSNIQRLRDGSEPRFTGKSKKGAGHE